MNALNRLNQYRANAAKLTESGKKHYGSDIVHAWRNNRYPVNPVLATVSIRRQDDTIYADRFEDAGFAVVDDAHELARLDHTGWYTDNAEDMTLIPVVLSLRNPRKINDDGGHQFYIAATRHSDWYGVTIYVDTVYTTPRAAAYATDSIAEREAEKAREYDAKDQAELRILEQREAIHDINREALPLIAELKSIALPNHICKAVKGTLDALLKQRAAAFNKIEELTAFI